MCWHNVLFKLSALISTLQHCSEDDANTLHFLVRCWITLSRCLFAASKEDPLSRLPLEHLIIHKGHSGMKSKAQGRSDEGNTFECLLYLNHNKTLLSILMCQSWKFIHLSETKNLNLGGVLLLISFICLEHTVLCQNEKTNLEFHLHLHLHELFFFCFFILNLQQHQQICAAACSCPASEVTREENLNNCCRPNTFKGKWIYL